MSHALFSSAYHNLPDSIKNLVKRIIQELNPYKIILFGSRARGDHRDNSDFDIAVQASFIPPEVWARLQIAIEEEPITLYHVDLVDLKQLSNDYKKRIANEGKVLYAR